MRLVRKWFRNNRKKESIQVEPNPHFPLSSEFDQNIKQLQLIYKDCSDVVFRSFLMGGKIRAMLIYIQGLSDVDEMDARVLFPLMDEQFGKELTYQEILQKKLAVSNVKEVEALTDCVESISIGNPVLLVEGGDYGFALGLAKWEKRSVEEPTAESVIRGPREGFTESIGVNTSLIRRRIRTPQLKMKSMKIGRLTQTEVILAYIEGIADPTLIEEANNRLKRIDIDGVLESGYIEEFIEDNPASPFPQILNTERPDHAVASLLEGRVVILVDGTPFVLVAPVTLYSFLQSSEDYYERFWISTSIRWLRFSAVVLAFLLPSLYVAVLTYHHEMVPTSLLITIASSRETVPFPALVEALIMEMTFEGLREAGVRLPKQVGAAVSIVGALVIGQSAVQAGIVSAPMVMVVAITGIASFTMPRYSAGITFRLLRFPMIICAGTLGFLGIMLGIIFTITHLCTLRSFGVPYLSPMAPMKFRDMKDILIRAPWWMLDTRPHLTGEYNEYRQSAGQKPGPQRGGGNQ